MKSAHVRFEFGDFRLAPDEHELRRAGEPVRLTRKDFELLVALVEREGRLARKDELLQRLWPDAFVEEGNLTKHVSTLRKALGEGHGSGPFIETVPRIGFRFVAPVRRVEHPEDLIPVVVPATADPPATSAAGAGEQETATSRSRRALVSLTAATMALAMIVAIAMARRHPAPPQRDWRALAVLPFITLDARDSAPDPLGLGLADGIISRLSAQRLLPVRPTSAVRGYVAGSQPDARTVGRALDAGVLLEGHIQRGGDTVRVTAQLTEVNAAAPIWAETFDQPTSELFRLEDAIAERVAAALRLQLAAAEQERLRRRYTANAAAYVAYLAGREALLRYTPEGAAVAISHFERALVLDPQYVLARAGLAMASADMYLRFARDTEVQRWGERAERDAAEAIALDPDLAEAHTARAAVYRKREFDWEQAIAESGRATTLNPNLDQPHFFAAAAFYHLGLMEQATTELGRGRAVGGSDVVEPLRIEALIALFSGNVDIARQRLESVSRLSSRAIGDVYLALAYYYSRDVARARRMLAELAGEQSASTASRSGAVLAAVLAASGETSAARAALAQVTNHQYRDHHVAYGLGTAFAQLGEAAEALRWLRSAADTGFPCAIWYTRDPLLAPIRNDPGFLALVKELNARHDAAIAKYARH